MTREEKTIETSKTNEKWRTAASTTKKKRGKLLENERQLMEHEEKLMENEGKLIENEGKLMEKGKWRKINGQWRKTTGKWRKTNSKPKTQKRPKTNTKNPSTNHHPIINPNFRPHALIIIDLFLRHLETNSVFHCFSPDVALHCTAKLQLDSQPRRRRASTGHGTLGSWHEWPSEVGTLNLEYVGVFFPVSIS